MLSRTAENLFWLARYLERAEATARLITMGQRMAILPGAHHREEWKSIIRVTGSQHLFEKDAVIRERDVVEHLVLNTENPVSIRSCLIKARANGKSVRTALTQDMWEALNEGWRTLESYDVGEARAQIATILDWVKARAMTFRGATESGHLRDEKYDFIRVGAALERAQSVLRLLDVKYYVLLPETDVVGGNRDHYQWTSVLYALSGNRAYHHVYSGVYSPWRITDFLMLNRRFPRSVLYCFDQMSYRLGRLAQWHGQRRPCHDSIELMVDELAAKTSGDIFRQGLHETVQRTLNDCNRIGVEIAEAYHFG